MSDSSKIAIENVISPGHKRNVDRAKFMAMHDALMAVLPTDPPGLTVAEAKAVLLPILSDELFPGGDKAGWWIKAVQLDQEAKGTIKRAPGSPVRLYKA